MCCFNIYLKNTKINDYLPNETSTSWFLTDNNIPSLKIRERYIF